jgi:hypothetical protein
MYKSFVFLREAFYYLLVKYLGELILYMLGRICRVLLLIYVVQVSSASAYDGSMEFIPRQTLEQYDVLYSSDDVYSTTALELYAEAENAENAKLDAIRQGAVAALHRVLARMTANEMRGRLSNVKLDQAMELIQHYEIHESRMTSNSYKARADFTFSGPGVKLILNKTGVIYTDKFSPRYLVLPVEQQESGIKIWQTEWYNIWTRAPTRYGLLRLNYPLADLPDIRTLDPLGVLYMPYSYFKSTLNRYSLDEALIVFAKQSDPEKLEVTIRFIGPKRDEYKYISYQIPPVGKRGDFYQKTCLDLISHLDSAWKGMDIFIDLPPYKTVFKVLIDSPGEWGQVRDRLNRIKAVENIKVLETTISHVMVELSYVTEPLVISELMAQQGLKISRNAGQTVIKLSSK